jgi:hypothetical protein
MPHFSRALSLSMVEDSSEWKERETPSLNTDETKRKKKASP